MFPKITGFGGGNCGQVWDCIITNFDQSVEGKMNSETRQ